MIVNIKQCPTPTTDKHPRHDVIGDLHGNTMFMLYFLIERGYINCTPTQYDELYRLYDKIADSNHSDDIQQFCKILHELTYQNQGGKITFLGDMLADRGANDFLTIELLSQLHNANIDYVITLSNHDICFMSYMDNEFTANQQYHFKFAYGVDNSCYQLSEYLQNNPNEKNAFQEKVQKTFYDKLRLIDYTETKNEFIQWTHAPAGDEIVNAFIQYYQLPAYDLYELTQRKQAIEAINQQFQEALDNSTNLAEIYTFDASAGNRMPALSKPYQYVTWNGQRSQIQANPEIIYGHGHDSHTSPIPNYQEINLDGTLGKYDETIGTYLITSRLHTSP